MMGGRETVLAKARNALDDGDAQWAAELATWVVRATTRQMLKPAPKSGGPACVGL